MKEYESWPKFGDYRVHPLADAFPLIDGEDFDALVANVKQFGQQEPIVFDETGTVLLDGRNRLRACNKAGVTPATRKLSIAAGDPKVIDFIVACNVARRHLTQSQKAVIALEIEREYAAASRRGRPKATENPAELRELKRKDRESASKAAIAVGASARYVQMAKAVQRDAPDLLDLVRAGKRTVQWADLARRRKAEESASAQDAEAAKEALDGLESSSAKRARSRGVPEEPLEEAWKDLSKAAQEVDGALRHIVKIGGLAHAWAKEYDVLVKQLDELLQWYRDQASAVAEDGPNS